MKLTLIDAPHYPIETLYTAYRVCYSRKPVSEIQEEIESGEITQEEIKRFLRRMFKTGHTAPLRQLHFVFVMERVSRVLTAQFNRHVIGVDRCEMSQRYSMPEKYIIPDNVDIARLAECGIDIKIGVESIYQDYLYMTNDYAVAHEDARYILPMGTESREQFSMSLEAMRHFLDVRLCECAQREIRNVAWRMYRIMRKRFPLLSSLLGVKCWENRTGYCDEMKGKYEKCKWSKKRPHKSDLMRMWKRKGLTESD